MANEREVSLRLTGDISDLQGKLNAAEKDLLDLERVGKKISILEDAQGRVAQFQGALQAAQIKVSALRTALSEAMAADADAPQIRRLTRDLEAAERAASKAEKALARSESSLINLNLAAGAAGVNTGNLTAQKTRLATETDKLKTKIDGLKTSVNDAALAERNLAAGANSINAAFATLSIRSADQIRAEILSINQALAKLASNANVSGAEFDRAYAGGQVKIAALRAELSGADLAAGKAGTSVSGLGASLRSLAAPLAGIEIARQFVEANVASESLERTLVQLTGSGEAAAAEIDYLKATAERLGLSVQEASRAYVSLTAAAKGTAMEGAGTRQVFEAVAGAMAKLGMSSADTEGALRAVSQMMSKGVASMEEWRQQLGERIPGAAQATADALGVTVAELNDMISSGNILSSELLPYLAQGLEKVYGTAGKAEGLIAAWNRLKNAINDTFTFVGDSGVWSGLVSVLGIVATAVRGLTGAFELLGKIVGITFGALVSFDFRRPIESVRNWKNAVNEAANEIQSRLDKAKASADGNAVAQQNMAEKTAAASSQAQQTSIAWLAVVNAYAKVGKAAKDSVEAAIKSAAARAEEGKAAIALAQAFGTESEKRVAALTSARNDADALRAVSDARRIEAEVAKSNAAALTEAAKAEASLSEEKRKAIEASNQAATAKGAEADQAAAASLAAQQRAAQLATETAMVQDNSRRINELRAAHEAAAVALENTRAARASGIATLAQEQEAAIAAGQAAAMYRDALNDQTRAIEYNASVKQSEANLAASSVKLQIEQAKTMAEVAKAYGDEASAASYLLQVKQLEIELARLTADAKQAEGRAALALVQAKRAELAASGEMTAAKEAELRAQELAAQVKLKEAEIANETADRMTMLAAATDDYTRSTGPATDGTSALTDSLNSSANGADRLTQSLQRLQQVQQQGGVGGADQGNGVRNVTTSPVGKITSSQVDFTETLYRRGASIEEQKLAQKYVGEYYARNQATMLTGNLGNEVNAARLQKQAINDAVDKAIAAARRELQTGQAVDLGTSVNDIIGRNMSVTQLRNGDDMIRRIQRAGNEANSQTININLGGKSTKVKVASRGDADNLAQVLRQLEMDSART